MKKRLLSAALCLCMVTALLPITSFAAGELDFEIPSESVILDGVGSVDDNFSDIQTWSIQPSAKATDQLYDQLDANSKRVYDTLKTAYQNGATAERINLNGLTLAGRTVTATVNGGTLYFDEADQELFQAEIRDAVTPAFTALVYDHSEMSWIANVQFEYSYGFALDQDSRVDLGNSQYSITATPKDVQFYLASAETNTGTKKDMDNALSKAKTALSKAPYSLTSSMTRAEKAKAIHDYVCDTVAYESGNVNLRQYQTAYSAFYDCDGDGVIESVCAGYAKSFMLLCAEYDIPCVLVSGNGINSSNKTESHMWDFVQLEDGKWYAVDCTWDDQSATLYDYFLAGSTTVDTHFNKKTFAASHLANGQLVAGYTFAYPTLNNTAYTTPTHTHTWDNGKVTKQPTCKDAGVKTYTCTVCGETKTEAIPKLTTHTWDNGKVTKEPTTTAEGEKTYTCTVCGETKIEAIAKLPTVSFTDVPAGEYYAVPVSWAVANGITAGTSPTTFSPNDTCTRAQVVTFLWRAKGKPEPKITKNPFTDVASNAYYYQAVLWAVEEKITSGTSETTFSPEDSCTRGQVATFLWRAEEEPNGGSNNPFNDVSSSDYYYKAILWAVSNGITNGTSGTTFSPNDTCTRGQVVTFLYRDLGEE